MSLREMHIDGYVIDKIQIAIDRLQAHEPQEGYYLAFSGGKDSQCIYHLAVEAGVKFDAHYNITGIDPPELVYFIRENYPEVQRHLYKKSMFKLIEKKGLPTRMKRWCCTELKEHGGEGRICVTGVRWAESTKRANRKPMEIITPKFEDKKLFNDNEEGRRMFENCTVKGKRVLNPIIDWTDEDVWEYLNGWHTGYEHLFKLPHCSLYDEGYNRIGCIGCPLASYRNMQTDFARYPKFLENYKRAFAKFLPGYFERCKKRGINPLFVDVDSYFEWWLYGKKSNNEIEGQISIFDNLLQDEWEDEWEDEE